jgi:hypothetical protein
MSSLNGEDQFICPALRAGQGEVFLMSHHQGRAKKGVL